MKAGRGGCHPQSPLESPSKNGASNLGKGPNCQRHHHTTSHWQALSLLTPVLGLPQELGRSQGGQLYNSIPLLGGQGLSAHNNTPGRAPRPTHRTRTPRPRTPRTSLSYRSQAAGRATRRNPGGGPCPKGRPKDPRPTNRNQPATDGCTHVGTIIIKCSIRSWGREFTMRWPEKVGTGRPPHISHWYAFGHSCCDLWGIYIACRTTIFATSTEYGS